MAMTCEDALASNLLSGGSEKKATSDSGVLPLTGGGNIGDKSLEDIINEASKKIGSLDCPDIVYEWLKDTQPFSAIVKFMGAGLEMLKKIGPSISGEALKTTVQSSAITGSICGIIQNVYAVIVETIELATKVAFVLFDAIDSLQARLNAALRNLTTAIMTCIMNVYDMIELFLCDVIKLSLITDWNSLQMFMASCPCVCKFIAWLTGCDKDDSGNDISTNAAAVILCIREKFWYLDAAQIGIGVSNILNAYLKKYLMYLYYIVNTCIDAFFTLLIIPFRHLIKKYVKFLRKKWDLTFAIDGLKTIGLDCLLVYSTETNSDGSTYYGMSILDMISTLQSWAPCLEYPCKSFGEQVKNKLKKYNRELRLASEYWEAEFARDIYASCVLTDAISDQSCADFLKEFASKWNNAWDNLKSKKMEAKHCADDAVEVTIGNVGDMAGAVNTMRTTFGAIAEDNTDPVADAAEFSESPNMEHSPNNGFRPLTTLEDDKLFQIGQNIYDALEDDEFFMALWDQYLRFIGRYRLFDPSFKKLCKLANGINNLPGTFAGSAATQFSQYDAKRPALDMDESSRRVNYFFTSDYDSTLSAKIMDTQVSSRGTSETLADYYARIYAETVG